MVSTLPTERGDRLFNTLNTGLLALVCVVVLYPLYFVIIASISEPSLVNTGGVVFFPRQVSLLAYRTLLGYEDIWRGYANTIFYTALGTTINLVLTLPAAYALSRKDLRGRGLIMALILFTMLFQGGLVPRYLVIRDLGLLDTVWAIVLPRAVLVVELVIARTFFQSTIPNDFLDAARMEGSSNVGFFLRIALPLAPALIAVEVIRYGVTHWNLFFDALILLKSPGKFPLQLVLRNILISNQLNASGVSAENVAAAVEFQKIADLIRYAVVVVGSLPFLLLYPFLQRFFVKGILIGGLKG